MQTVAENVVHVRPPGRVSSWQVCRYEDGKGVLVWCEMQDGSTVEVLINEGDAIRVSTVECSPQTLDS